MVLMSVILTAGILLPAGAAYAQDSGQLETDQVLQMQNMKGAPFGFRKAAEAEALLEAAEAYPEQFDLRNVNGQSYVTPVKLQNPFGTCWGFAAIAAAESSVLGSGLAQQDGYDAATLDFSEKHLVNFLVRPIEDKSSPQYGEGLYFLGNFNTLEDRLNAGGTPFYATSLFSSGMGPVLESRDPVLEYYGANKDTEKRKADGAWIDFCYSDEDDWSIPDEWRFRQSYVLKESYILPAAGQWVKGKKDPAPHYEYDPAGTAAIKEQLINLRAVEIAFHADQSTPDQENDGQYISKNWAHYTYQLENANHAVTIVGWDDNYDRSNFVEGHEPPGNGAWLVKNSWGSGEQSFPDRGRGEWGMLNDKGEHTGYFWLSYYDTSLCMAEALAFDKSNVNQEYILDQHDFMPVSSIMSADQDKEIKMANVFKAEMCEKVEQIACQTAAPGTVVDYQIYLLQPEYTDPEDGLLVTSGSAQYQYGGYHKIDIEPQIIQRGQCYSIIVTQKTPDGKYNMNLPVGQSKELATAFGNVSYAAAVINPGESFVMTDGTWKDYSDQKVRMELLGGFIVSVEPDNFPIRAFSMPMDNFYMSVATGNTMTLKTDDQVTADNIVIKFKDDMGKLPADAELQWEAAKGSEKFFTMTPNASDSSRCMVVPVAAGTGYIKVSNPDTGAQIIRVDVKDPNTLDVAGKKATVRYSKLKKKGMTLPVSKVLQFKNKGQGTITYSLEGVKKNNSNKDYSGPLYVNPKSGKVKIKKNVKKGNYVLSVIISATGDQLHAAVKKDLTFQIRIK